MVSTAFAFALWNHTLRTLTAARSSVLNSTMVVPLAFLAWVALGERISVVRGLGLVGVGAATVQLEPGGGGGRRAVAGGDRSGGEARG